MATRGRGAELLGCGHYVVNEGDLGGVCMHRGCGRQICVECSAVCERCGKVLCKGHERLRAYRTRTFCPWCNRVYTLRLVLRGLARMLLPHPGREKDG